MKRILFSTFILFLLCLPVLAQEYKRIVSLAPSVTESLCELGLESDIVGITIFCPKGNTPKEMIGTLLEPDTEKIAVLKPDLIVSTKEGNNKAAVEKLVRLGFNVYVMESSDNFIEICSNFYGLAKKTGQEENAGKIIDKAKETISDVLSKLEDVPQQDMFWEVGAKPLYTAGKYSFVNDYNYYTKTVNVYADVEMRYPLIDIEDVLERNPEIIVLVNMGDISAEEVNVWKKYATLNAVKNGKIFMIDVNDVFTPTPSTFAKGVTILSKILYPEIFVD